MSGSSEATKFSANQGDKIMGEVTGIEELVRSINAETFSESAYGAGHRVVLVDKRAGPYKKSVLGGLFGRKGEHYFVKKFSVPKDVHDWKFTWTEGTSAISLDFTASFVIQANEDVQAYRLVEALAAPPNPGKALHDLIHAALSDELNRMLRDCNRMASSLLDHFKRSSIGVGECEELNVKVGDRVRESLGVAVFRIGFQLRQAPPMQIEFSRTGAEADTFTLADSQRPRTAETKALLKLTNYQAFKKSGLKLEDDVKREIGKAVTQAVKELLFARKYYDVVQSFSKGSLTIAQQMRARIESEAAAIGYQVNMFQTLPDIAALKLLEPLRVDIPAESAKYDLKHAVGYVQFSVSLMTRAGNDVSRLHLLIDPDAENVVKPISERVQQIARDTVQRFDHFDFNLQFEEKVVPALQRAIDTGLASYGLMTEIVNIRQSPTEEGQRFKAIRGRTIDFKTEISPLSNRGKGDPIPVAGTIEVVGMSEQGWESFQSKDFGFRSDSALTVQRLRAMASLMELPVPEGTWSDADRRIIAIDLELHQIRKRVMAVLEGQMAMGPDLAEHWTSATHSRQISAWAERLAADAIQAEFGLVIEVRGFRRLDADTDLTEQAKRRAHHKVIRDSADADAVYALQYERDQRSALDRNRLALITELGQRDKEALQDPDSAQGDEVAQRLREELAKDARRPRLTPERSSTALQPRQATGANRELPWAPAPKATTPEGPQDGSS